MRVKINLHLEDEGSIVAINPNDTSEKPMAVMLVPNIVFSALNLFDESRAGFSWEEDCQQASAIVEIAINRLGFEVFNGYELQKAITVLCTPGGPAPGLQSVWLMIEDEFDGRVTGTGHTIGVTYKSNYWGGQYKVIDSHDETGVLVECVVPGDGAHQRVGERWTHRTKLDPRDTIVKDAAPTGEELMKLFAESGVDLG